MNRTTKLVVILLLVVVAVCSLYIFRTSTQTSAQLLQIYQHGTLIQTVDLSHVQKAYTIELKGENGAYNTVSVESGRVCISHASCPDQVCVHQGWISDSTLPIVCLPNEIILEITGGGADLDTIAG